MGHDALAGSEADGAKMRATDFGGGAVLCGFVRGWGGDVRRCCSRGAVFVLQ